MHLAKRKYVTAGTLTTQMKRVGLKFAWIGWPVDFFVLS